MIRILIDGAEAEVGATEELSLSLDAGVAGVIKSGGRASTKIIKLPMTARNAEILGHYEQVNSPGGFNRTRHEAKVEVDGCSVLEGTAVLLSCCGSDTQRQVGYYELAISVAGAEWASRAAQTSIRNAGLEFSEAITAQAIHDSWTWDKPVRFLPVARAGVQESGSGSVYAARILGAEDYHPFINIRSLIRKVLEDAGYGISSDFMDSAYFGSLYMSGNYGVDSATAAVVAEADFRAGRLSDVSATADQGGYVYCDALQHPGYSVGNIVESADPVEVIGGAAAEGVFDNSGNFGREKSRIVYRPESTVVAGFEYSLLYKTEYRILDRNRLRGFDTIRLAGGEPQGFWLENRFSDRRANLQAGNSYMLIVFDHQEGDSYNLVYDGVQVATSSARTKTFTVPAGITSGQAGRLLIKRSGGTVYSEYGGDWALYDGYVTERGETTVSVKVRSAAEEISRSKPKYFADITFSGAEQGMRLTVLRGTAIQPVFAGHPTDGSGVDFTQVAAHNASCLDLINAVGQMFNLRFYTNEISRTVYVEPYADFYRAGPVVDLGGRVDLGKPVVISDYGGGMAKATVFGYKSGDSAVARYNRSNGGVLGRWTAYVESNASAPDVASKTNPLFTASVSATRKLPQAPSALLLEAGSDNAADLSKGESLNFPAKVVHYLGMAQLPQGEAWGWPSYGRQYPLAVFHYPTGGGAGEGTGGPDEAGMRQEGCTLCFEDRDGMRGLNRYWGKVFEAYGRARTVELSAVLHPHEVEQLIFPNDLGRDIRGMFEVELDGESVLCRLEKIESYDPAGGNVARCVFRTEI